jgi:glutathione S-transferase
VGYFVFGCRGISKDLVELVHTGLETDHRGIMVFTMPDGDPVTDALGTKDLIAFNPEGWIPVLLLPDGRKMTQSGTIIDFIEDQLTDHQSALMPVDPWLRAEVRRIMWIIAADVQPYQNIPFIIQAMGEWGMVKASPTLHPLRLHFIRREFGVLEGIMAKCLGCFAVGKTISLADCFLVPQIRNALLAGIGLDAEFPTIAKVFKNTLLEQLGARVVEIAGGIKQHLAFGAEKFEIYSNKY